MKPIKIFLSSRVNSKSFSDSLDRSFTLKELRKFLRDRLESEKLHSETQIWDVIINETDFDSSVGSKDAYDNCMDKLKDSNLVVILYNGEAGWGISEESNGICHDEFIVAVNYFSSMSYCIDLRKFFSQDFEVKFRERNQRFSNDIESNFGHMEELQGNFGKVSDLFEGVYCQVKRYLLKAIESSFETQKRIDSAASVFGETLDWSKLSYPERQSQLVDCISESFGGLIGFEDTIKSFLAIPDHMSVADARNRIGRPFVYEHQLLDGRSENSGVIHFVGVYGNISEIQAKNLVGYPDIAVIKSPFGFYLWEKNVHIQIFFFKNCINRQTVRTRLTQTTIWLNRSKENEKILKRAKSRYSILTAINNAKTIFIT